MEGIQLRNGLGDERYYRIKKERPIDKPVKRPYPTRIMREPDVVLLNATGSRMAVRCGDCGGRTPDPIAEGVPSYCCCEACGDVGWIGVDPTLPIEIPPGPLRSVVYRARYVAGLPLWNPEDNLGGIQ